MRATDNLENNFNWTKESKLTDKLTKRKKNALNHLDQLVLQRLSDYFTCWKLKILLG